MQKSNQDQTTEDQILTFESSAYLERLIGRELISSDYIAVAELVKNAYDAGATEVTIELENDKPQKMIISDNGVGISLDEFRRLWMVLGYSEKTETESDTDRPYLGEKGIGRFAADRIAKKLRVITKKKEEDDALFVEFNWEEFNREKKLQDIPIPYFRKPDSLLGKEHSGTRLELEELRKEWSNKDWNQLRRELQSLIAPFGAVKDFKIFVKAKGWYSGEIKSLFETKEGYKYTFSMTPKGGLRYEFVRPRQAALELEKDVKETGKRGGVTYFGPIRGAFYYLDQPGSITRAGFEPGVGIYRDGFRVEPYGRENDDWLEVKSWKAKRQGHAPVNPSRLFGFIVISRYKNPQLRDVTNREGLIDTKEFREFREFVKDQFHYFATIIEQDREELDVRSAAYEAQQEESDRKARAKAFAEMSAQLAHQLRQPLSHIRMSSANIKTRLAQMGISDEQIQKSTDRIERNIQRMDEQIESLSSLAKGLKDPAVTFDLGTFVEETVYMHEEDYKQSGVELSVVNCGEGHMVKFGKVALSFVLENFLTNALKAVLNRKNSRKPKVSVEIEEPDDGSYRVCVIDNGDGVPKELGGKLFKSAISSSGGEGAGLFWSRIWAEQYGGSIGFEEVKPSGALFYIQL
ncbi:MAG TPA: sensor histidine kinase [Blastocatellia bacterium]|nr:sensor histidine kinase [Blastocatellia bacterium]